MYGLKLTDTHHTIAIYDQSPLRQHSNIRILKRTVPRVRDFIAESVANILYCSFCCILPKGAMDSWNLHRMSRIDNYEVDSMVCGYHVYHCSREVAVGQTLPCQRETSIPRNPYVIPPRTSSSMFALLSLRVQLGKALENNS